MFSPPRQMSRHDMSYFRHVYMLFKKRRQMSRHDTTCPQKTALTTDPSQKEAYSRQKKIKSGPGRVLGLAYVGMPLEGRHRSGACRVDCHDLSRLSWPIVAGRAIWRQISRHVKKCRSGFKLGEANVATSSLIF